MRSQAYLRVLNLAVLIEQVVHTFLEFTLKVEVEGRAIPETNEIVTHICIRGPASSQLYISGGVYRKRKEIAEITAKAFSYPHTEFGARRSRHVGVRSAKN